MREYCNKCKAKMYAVVDFEKESIVDNKYYCFKCGNVQIRESPHDITQTLLNNISNVCDYCIKDLSHINFEGCFAKIFRRWGCDYIFVFCNKGHYRLFLKEAMAIYEETELDEEKRKHNNIGITRRQRRIKVMSGGLPSLGKRR